MFMMAWPFGVMYCLGTMFRPVGLEGVARLGSVIGCPRRSITGKFDGYNRVAVLVMIPARSSEVGVVARCSWFWARRLNSSPAKKNSFWRELLNLPGIVIGPPSVQPKLLKRSLSLVVPKKLRASILSLRKNS